MKKQKLFNIAEFLPSIAYKSISLSNKVLKSTVTFLCVLAFIVFPVTSQAQTGRASRSSLNSLSNSDLKTLHDAILTWITDDLVIIHGNQFPMIHRTVGFLPWHREHLVDLEEYLVEQGLSQFVPLPFWDPANPVPLYFNGFDPMGNNYNNLYNCTGCTGFPNPPRDDYSTFTNNGLPAAFVKHATNPTGTDNDLCDFWNISRLSDAVEGELAPFRTIPTAFGNLGFHNATHVNLGGIQPGGSAAAAALFWPWHAFVDEVWFKWDCDCKMKNGNTINGTTIAEAYDEITDITITTAQIWDGSSGTSMKKISGRLTIAAGGSLTLKNGFIVEMIGDNYVCGNTGIVVEAGFGGTPGGILKVESGARVRGISTIGKDGVDFNIPATAPEYRVQYNNVWQGVRVYGASNENSFSSLHGRVLIDGQGDKSTGVYWAEIGIESFNGGIIDTKDASFINCFIGVKIGTYNYVTEKTRFYNTDFIWEDQSTYRYYMHYVHPYHDQAHIWLESVHGIDIGGCKFENQEDFVFTSGGTHSDNRGTGIYCFDATTTIHKDGTPTENLSTGCPDWSGTNASQFIGLSFGISASGTAGNHVTQIGVQQAVFTDNHDAITMEESHSLRVVDAIFNYSTGSAHYNSNDHHHFIETENTDFVFIYKCNMTSDDPEANFISVNNAAGYAGTRINSNTLTNNHAAPTASFGINTIGTHTNTEIHCNTFTAGFNACIRNFGSLKNQGTPVNPAGNIFPTYNAGLGLEQRLKNEPGASPYTYFFQAPIGGSQDPDIYRTANITRLTSSGESFCTFNCAGNALSINSFNKLQNVVTIYPNPSSIGSVHIDILRNFDTENYTYTITDITGRVVKSGKLEDRSNIVDINNAASGIYMVSIVENGLLVNVYKLVLNH